MRVFYKSRLSDVSIEEDGMIEWIPCKGYSSNVSLSPCLHTSTTYMMRATRTEAAKEPLTINAISQLSKSFSILSRMSSNSLPTMVPRMPLMKPPLQVSPMKVTLPSIASIVSWQSTNSFLLMQWKMEKEWIL